MPFEALSAKARLIVPVGAIDSRWLLRVPVRPDLGAQISSGSRSGIAGGEVPLRVEQRKRPLLPRQRHARADRPRRASAASASAAISRASALS